MHFFFTFIKKPFIRNVLAISSGTAASQAITMAFIPFITRLYGPEAYGIQGTFMSIAGVLGTVAALTYPIAIVLPKHEKEAINLVKISIIISILMSLLVALILTIFGTEIFLFLKMGTIFSFMYFLPVFMLTSTIGFLASQWLVRKNSFSKIGKVSVAMAILSNSMKTSLGYVYPSAIYLILTNTLNGFLSAILMLIGLKKTKQTKELPNSYPLSIWSTAKYYRDFPLFRAPQELLKSVFSNIPVIMLAIFFGTSTVGYYSIASAVLGVPLILIGVAVMQVFYPRISTAIHNGEDIKKLIMKATLGLGLIGMPIYTIIVIAGPELFDFIFGPEWRIAGEYGRWMSIWFFFQFINVPALSAIPALQLQKGALIFELLITIAKVFALYIGFIHFNNDIIAISLFSTANAIGYISLIFWVLFYADKHYKFKENHV